MPITTIRQLQIDIFGPCNLRCPTCLVGSSSSEIRKTFKGLMSPETFQAILDKAKSEAPALAQIAMHNWTEPLLHPLLPELVQIAKKRDLHVYVSSNLNLLRREDDLLRSGLDKLAVSVSGWDQERYGVYHEGGDIAAVKANMQRLAAAKARTGSSIRLVCIFHRYRDNRRDEEIMGSYAHALGFEFAPTWAFFTPVEKLLASQSADRCYGDVRFDAKDDEVAQRLAVPISTRLALGRAIKDKPCIPLHTQLPIDASGDVRLCCASGFVADNRIGQFLDRSLEQIQETRETHRLCDDCGACGIPNYYYCPAEDLDRIGNSLRAAFEAEQPQRPRQAIGGGKGASQDL